MEPGKIVFQGAINNTVVLVRYPTMDDIAPLQEFINTASVERMHISLQGDTFTFEEEAQYLDDVLEKIKAQKAVKLMVFAGNQLLGVGDITCLKSSTTKHVASLGLIVAKRARGQGIGRKLMELLIAETKSHLPGVEIVILSVYQQNKVARKLYSSLGFIEYGRLPSGRKRGADYDDEVEMFLPVR